MSIHLNDIHGTPHRVVQCICLPTFIKFGSTEGFEKSVWLPVPWQQPCFKNLKNSQFKFSILYVRRKFQHSELEK